jgi:hypothetical protein
MHRAASALARPSHARHHLWWQALESVDPPPHPSGAPLLQHRPCSTRASAYMRLLPHLLPSSPCVEPPAAAGDSRTAIARPPEAGVEGHRFRPNSSPMPVARGETTVRRGRSSCPCQSWYAILHHVRTGCLSHIVLRIRTLGRDLLAAARESSI